jgi:hypothetical protein
MAATIKATPPRVDETTIIVSCILLKPSLAISAASSSAVEGLFVGGVCVGSEDDDSGSGSAVGACVDSTMREHFQTRKIG